jgi:hypothetical protein
MYDIPGSTEVYDHRYGSNRQGLKHDTSSEVANRWKHQQISGSHPPEDFRMADPTPERHSLFDSK